VTAFPFTDPSPDTSDAPLVGIRFDIPTRDGTFGSPYYIFCKRLSDESAEMKLHRHTLPALVPIARYEETYLPMPDEGYGSEDSMLGLGSRQDLQGFVNAVRSDLVSWQLRMDSIQLAREKLKLKDQEQPSADPDEDEETGQSEGVYGITAFEPATVDARLARIVWSDGRVGRVKISDDGSIQLAAVIGADEKRHHAQERLLVDGGRIETLVVQLKEIHEQKAKAQ
jgi:central kinetochore subunit Mal2/MCM21